MQSFLTEGTQVVGVKAKDGLADEELSIFAKQVVTCTGDASTDLKNLAVPENVFSQMRFAKAVNVIVSRTATESALALRAKGAGRKKGHSRLLFFVPWQNATMIGTWYFRINTNKNDRYLREEELNSILSQINTAYPALEVTSNDITFVHLGRLPALPGETPTGEPRLMEHGRLIDHGRSSGWSGLWSVVGVKYTTARAVAEKVLGSIFGKNGTECLKKWNCVNTEACQHRVRNADETQLNPEGGEGGQDKLTAQLSAAFEHRAIEVAAWAGDDPSKLTAVPGCPPLPQTVIHYAIQHESVWHLTDLLLRRTNIGASARPARETIDWTLDHLGRHLGWDEAQKQREIKMLDEHYNWWK
jgi:glycerol-3-phosphate dehydrogenase